MSTPTLIIYNDAGEIHCDDGPAITFENGVSEWYQQGKLHRIGGPARTPRRRYGSTEWYFEGLLHREDGPAWKKRHDTKMVSSRPNRIVLVAQHLK